MYYSDFSGCVHACKSEKNERATRPAQPCARAVCEEKAVRAEASTKVSSPPNSKFSVPDLSPAVANKGSCLLLIIVYECCRSLGNN